MANVPASQMDICAKLYDAELPAYPGFDVDDYVKMCNSAPDDAARCGVLDSFALASYNSLKNVVPTHTCREF